ncbi:hypothetical protein GGX14DRAFT_700963 [Mycena pura]|uniref:Fungal calcium binding protein domain-containing protein n=1 Tax=Mycena pura TaxID=153505 RepID=A0AAD6UWU3_9AGAR|nr:hypothetical protein GGX14DRAFT_700963 [Mycena pura]
MQFSLVALFVIAATSVSAGPLRMRQSTCDLKTCVLDLAPTGVSCAAAAAQADIDVFSDAGCIVSAAQDVASLPASCSGCLDQLGVAGDLEKAKNAVEGIF